MGSYMNEISESESESDYGPEYMVLGETGKTGYEIEEYMKKAIFDNLLEFEVIYGTTLKKDCKKIDKEIFLRLIKRFNESIQYTNIGESSSLDIRTEYRYKGKSAMSNIRASVNGMSNIKKYCLTDSLDGLNPVFLKKNSYKDPLQPSQNFSTLQNIHHNFRINLKNEYNLSGETNEEVLQFKKSWSRKNKMFRYKKRFSFLTQNKLFRIDITAVKTNTFNRKTNQYEYSRTFKESNILMNPEIYELEIEYVGSNESDVVKTTFTPENLPVEEYLLSHDKSHSFMNVINPFMSSYDNTISFSPSLELEDLDLSQFDTEPSYTFDSPKYYESEDLSISERVFIDDSFFKENNYKLSGDTVFTSLMVRINYQPTKDMKKGDYHQVNITPGITSLDKDNNEITLSELWIPSQYILTSETQGSQISYGGGPPKRVPQHKQSYREKLFNKNAIIEILTVLDKVIYEAITFIDDTKYILDYYEKEDIFGKYASMLRTNIKTEGRAQFIGPQPVSISLKDVQPMNPHSILQGYVVTEKADGIRAQLYIDPRNNKGYLVTPKREVFDTGTYFENVDSPWIFDGEYITKNRNGEDIKLFMIFDVYWGSFKDKTLVPNFKGERIHQLPWISRSKKEPSRSQFIHEFQKNISLIIDDKDPNSNIRIGFKNYIEGPKNLTKKKNSEDYSNLNGIFKTCKKILDIEDKKGGFEYLIDGLILLPMYLPVKCSYEGEKIVDFGGTWYHNFKWKPPEENTIDFRVTYEKNHKVYTTTTIDEETGEDKIIQYKKIFLSVGYNESDDSTIDFNLKQALNLPRDSRKNILFKKDEGFHTSNVLCKNKKVLCKRDNKEIKENDIVEMRYEKDDEKGFQWVPLRIRSDKVRPQYFTIANNIWDTIQNPVTKDLISGKDDLNNHLIEDLNDNKAYYVNKSDYDNSKPLRSLHNYIKSLLIHEVCSVSEFKGGLSVIDMSCGRGGDNGKYLSSENKLEFLLGLDISSNVSEAASRYYYDTQFRDKYKNKPKALFLQYDTSKSILNKEGCLGKDCDKYLDILLGSDKPQSKDMIQIHKIYNGLLKHKFNVVSSQFTLHYYFKDEQTLRGYLQNLSDVCHKDGYFIGTCYDGMKLYKTFMNQESEHISMDDDMGIKVYDIHKKYDIESFDYDKDNLSNMFGNVVDVYMSSIGQYIEEYLVNFEFFIDIMDEYGFTLQSPKFKKKTFINGPIGNFDDIIDNLDSVKDDKSFKKYYRDAMEVMKIKEYKILSGLNNWFIFKKTS